MPLLLLIRHGENDYTRKHKLAGYTPDVHLNERAGQAQALAEALKECRSKPFTRARWARHRDERPSQRSAA
jgi:broad specificity phosphatase PhoE